MSNQIQPGGGDRFLREVLHAAGGREAAGPVETSVLVAYLRGALPAPAAAGLHEALLADASLRSELVRVAGLARELADQPLDALRRAAAERSLRGAVASAWAEQILADLRLTAEAPRLFARLGWSGISEAMDARRREAEAALRTLGQTLRNALVPPAIGLAARGAALPPEGPLRARLHRGDLVVTAALSIAEPLELELVLGGSAWRLGAGTREGEGWIWRAQGFGARLGLPEGDLPAHWFRLSGSGDEEPPSSGDWWVPLHRHGREIRRVPVQVACRETDTGDRILTVRIPEVPEGALLQVRLPGGMEPGALLARTPVAGPVTELELPAQGEGDFPVGALQISVALQSVA